MINFKDVSFQYPQAEQFLFKNVNLRIPANSLTLLSGPSGSGKSTLLRCINGLVPHFSGGAIAGEISVCGLDPIDLGPEKMAATVGLVFQEPEAQFVYDTVEDEIAFSLENFGLPRADMHRRVQEIIHALGLDSLRTRTLNSLSGGEKQKVALASVMAHSPKVLLLDEPTSQLDPATAEGFLEFLLGLKIDFGLTVLISEHRLERILPFIDHIINLDESHEISYGNPQEILPLMEQVPPMITIGRKLQLSPLPLSVSDFPEGLATGRPKMPPLSSGKQTDRLAIIALRDFSVSLAGEPVLDRINLDIYPGEILIILGPNAAGKTTLLRSLLGLIPSTGQRKLNGKDMHTLKLSNLVETIAYLPQNPNDLLFAETVLDELKTTLKNHALKKSEVELQKFLDLFRLASMKDRFPRDLSVGERQRTALAAITVHEPQVMLLDEPTRGMDYNAKIQLGILLKSWREQDKAILLVTHDVEFAAGLSNRTVIIEGGRIVFDGSPRAAFTQFPRYQTQTARIFPDRDWISPDEVIYP